MILVTGPGRSGTSLAAMLLHAMGVDMGEGHLEPPRACAPEGSHEDLRYRALHVAYERSEIDRAAFVAALVELSAERAEPWGVKDPRASLMLDEYREAFGDFALVVCDRETETTAASWSRWFRTPPDRAREMVDRRRAAVSAAAREWSGPLLWLAFDDRWQRDRLALTLRTFLTAGVA